MPRSLSAHLMLSASLALGAVIFLVFGTWAAVVRYAPEWVQARGLSEAAGELMSSLRFDASGRPVAIEVRKELRPILEALPLDYLYQVIDANGQILLSSAGNSQSLVPPGWTPGSGPEVSEQTRAGLKLHVMALPIAKSREPAYLVVARSTRFDEAATANEGAKARVGSLVTTVIALTVFASVVLITVNRLLRRLRSVSEAAARIDPANLTARLVVGSVPQELAPLIESFNSALARLERGYRIQQDFLATAAHELKTPLTLMRGEVETGQATNRAVLLKDLDHMSRQVHQLLHLAEVSDAGNFTVARIDAAMVVADAVEFLARMMQARELTVDLVRPQGEAPIEADRGALFVLVRNLVENAAHHSAARAVITVSVDREGLTVRDRGPGIPDADMPMLFNRFWRGAHRRDEGAGLGLSICQEIARGHGWQISVANAAPGAAFTVQFKPAADPPPTPRTRTAGLRHWRWTGDLR